MKASASARPRLARAALSIVLLLFGVALAVSACVRQTKVVGQEGGRAPASVPPSATATAPAPGTGTTSPASPRPGNQPAGQPAAASPRLPAPYLPLWPFGNGQQVLAWQASYQSGGHQPWHLSARQTALSFTQGYLGYTEINQVAAATVSGGHARVAVGLRTDAGRVGTAAVIHLVRYGAGRLAPWEVVGTDDATLSLAAPAYGARIGTHMTVGGRITGVDESIRVQVRRQSSGAPAGEFCCVPAGGRNQPWSAPVTVPGTARGVLTIAASTGGHLSAVERFAITGVVR
ncbi:MAG TPA: hypothetical protein VE465_17665 [Streptosporangiaceae bacterium]|nr:hypothetical protein [Streptosporangiaceae bacterium]